jgi:hypothetical protein
LQEQRRSAASLRAIIGDAIKQKHPATIGDLKNLVMAGNMVDEGEFIETVKAMAEDGSLNLAKPLYDLESVLDYLLTPALSAWFWSTIGLTAFSALSVFIAPTLFPFSIARWLFGSILVLYLSGYALVEFLFPAQEELGQVERFAFSVALSLCLDIMVGLVINYIPSAGLRLEPIVASLSALVLIFGTAALARKYRGIRRNQLERISEI